MSPAVSRLSPAWLLSADGPQSRKQHETGLKHQGNKERFIRDLYKSGNMAKKEKLAAEAEMERINAVSSALPHAGRT